MSPTLFPDSLNVALMLYKKQLKYSSGWIWLPNRIATLQFLRQEMSWKSVNPWKLPCSLAWELCSRERKCTGVLGSSYTFSMIFWVVLSGDSHTMRGDVPAAPLKICQKVLLAAFLMCCEISQWRILSKWKSYSHNTDNGPICIPHFLYHISYMPENNSVFQKKKIKKK